MTSITYPEIYSKFFSKAKAYDLAMLPTDDVNDYLLEYVHSAVADPYILQVFSSLDYIDEVQEIKFELKREVNQKADKDFVIEIMAITVLMSYVQSHIYNPTNLSQVFSDADAKFYSQATQLSTLQNIYDSLHALQRRTIGDRGYIYNSYLGDE